ncbi:hypothetical protein ACQKL5_18470 [Peribacillus sp. NPDC097675]|uniref:hypothetical protein n=1 Tax=Peribacillus sp. NPDC097675 TaxID=3390618 RepID=UPI003D029E92
MKKYLLFILSFLLLFNLLQILAGILLTATYTPESINARDMSHSLSQEVTFGAPSQIPTLLIATLAASLAYLVPKKWAKK